MKSQDFRVLLQNEFVKRCRKNPQYSMRAFATQLDVDQSLLSKVLRGQRNPSLNLVEKIGEKIGLSPQNIAFFLGEESEKKTQGYDSLAEDTFAVIADWYHFAILELIKIKGSKAEAAWFAERLAVSKVETQSALERLERLGFIKLVRKRWTLLNPNNSWSSTEATTIAKMNLQKALLEKSLQSIDDVPFDKRENGSLTVACDESLIPEIRKRMVLFRRELDKFIKSQGNYNNVYQLVVSFFPLTKNN